MRMPTYFLCHGGGPWPWMQGPLRRILAELERGLLNVPAQWPTRPTAILVISAHWEERAFTVTTAEAPGMVYDYTGFPPEMYAIRYACPGSPSLAARVVHLLRAAGLPAVGSATRGYDHGTYSVLQTMAPTADIPVVQLSMRRLLDPDEHLQAGRALAALRDEGVLIIGSGMTCHERGPDMATPSAAFDDWLQRVVCDQDAVARRQSLRMWERAPYARVVHPREDHLLPLMVAAGAGWDDPARCVYRDRLMGFVTVSSYRFGGCASDGLHDE